MRYIVRISNKHAPVYLQQRLYGGVGEVKHVSDDGIRPSEHNRSRARESEFDPLSDRNVLLQRRVERREVGVPAPRMGGWRPKAPASGGQDLAIDKSPTKRAQMLKRLGDSRGAGREWHLASLQVAAVPVRAQDHHDGDWPTRDQRFIGCDATKRGGTIVKPRLRLATKCLDCKRLDLSQREH